MGSQGGLAPQDAQDAAAFVGLLRQLKEESGLTYRQLEDRAADRGEVLARSTLADVLRRATLPRPETLAVFVRACSDDHDVGAWLEARDRIAAGGGSRDGNSAATGVAWLPRGFRLLSVVAVALVLAAFAWIIVPDSSNGRAARASASIGKPDSGQPLLLSSEECPGVLVKGAHNLCVQELQKRLQHHGLDLPADAVFGPYTKMRLMAFQAFAGIPLTAMADETTKKALYEETRKIDTWTPKQVERRLREVFPEQPEKAVRLVRCLTLLDPIWIWGNPDGSRRWGLFQFSDLELMELGAEPLTALNPERNIQLGRAVWERTKDFNHWSCQPNIAATAERRS